jgi:ankyrin repeat protein
MSFFRIVIVPFFLMQVSFLNLVWASDKDHSLFEAVKANNMSEIKQLLKDGVNVNLKDEIGQPALIHACTKGYKDIAEFLLSKGADINAKDDVGGTALMYAGLGGHVDAVGLLLDKGAKFEARDVMKNTALIRVAARGHGDVARLLLERGADVNAKGAYGMTPLMWAASQGDIVFVQLLLNYGAEVNAIAKDGITALMVASGPVCIEEKGQYGSTNSISIKGGNKKILKLLLDHDADVDAKDVRGNTAMFYAIQKGDDSIKSLLLSYGAK